MKILVINGVNLNMLGQRETDMYGDLSLSDLENNIKSINFDADIDFFQSNSILFSEVDLLFGGGRFSFSTFFGGLGPAEGATPIT